MSEMTGRVARAICAKLHGHDKCWCDPSRACSDRVDVARIAISAMREPTDAMLRRAELCDARYDDPPTYGETYWRAMIDAALKDG